MQRIQKTQSEDEDTKDYINREITYILKSIAKKFVKKFHTNLMQRHNKATALVRRLEKEYIVYKIYAFT